MKWKVNHQKDEGPFEDFWFYLLHSYGTFGLTHEKAAEEHNNYTRFWDAYRKLGATGDAWRVQYKLTTSNLFTTGGRVEMSSINVRERDEVFVQLSSNVPCVPADQWGRGHPFTG